MIPPLLSLEAPLFSQMTKNFNDNTYILVDDNKILNEKHIRWVKKMNECLHVCTKYDGCVLEHNTNKVCKTNSPESYERLNRHFVGEKKDIKQWT